MPILHQMQMSGNCYKVRLTAKQVGVPLRNDWFGGKCYSVADIAPFAYTHCAGDGGFDLAAFPAVTGWLDPVREQPGHVRLAERW